MDEFLSPPPTVRLVNSFSRAFDNVVATARTCYSGRGIVTEDDVSGDEDAAPEERERRRERRDNLARSLYEAGHHTTLQHAHFQFSLSNVSRHFLWSFLHAHPFYNSEQVSQRYVEVKPGAYAVPPLAGEAHRLYQETVSAQHQTYRRLTELLTPLVSRHYYARFPARTHHPERYDREVKKKAQEVARYVLPVATFAYLYHTVSGITLLRYARLSRTLDTPHETCLVLQAMLEELLRAEPDYAVLLEAPLELEETLERQAFLRWHGERERTSSAAREFDAALGGRLSLLVDWPRHNEQILAQSVREVLGLGSGQLSDDQAIEMVLHPARNPYLGEAMNVSTLSKLSRCLAHPHYTFRKKLSHTADSQDQRHRMTPASRPVLAAWLSDEPDYVTPPLVEEDAEAHAIYRQIMERTWETSRRLRALGVSEEYAQYVLPNALAIRFTQSADLLNLHHKHAMRLCYNAQEEIWRAAKEEAEQIAEIDPRIGRHLLPPCTLRLMAGRSPVCPEGTRYCGEPVWRYELKDYRRAI